eukprot:TRINITY_DN10738_c0_g1_i1.p5 TRINITY_DN10738_c0_g1~~TRINITY_DN10738_c0_g1_i1.p5  ORF type:complete len:102 (-),score=36.36 TRINITY_DN10738_c0_g1_i1:15-320(-)
MEGDWEGVESERELKANEDMIESMFQREKRKMWERPVDEIVDIIEGKGIKTKLGEKSGKKKNKKKRQDETKNVRAVLELSLIHICRCRRYAVCRSRWSPYH